MRTKVVVVALLAAVAPSACSSPDDAAARSTTTTIAAAGEAKPSPEPTPTPKKRSDRYIKIADAVARLQPHLDVPVVLPHDKFAGLPDLRGWRADPKYLDWTVSEEGVTAGQLELRKGRKILIVSYGLSGFDGCGGREMALRTDVLGQPALATDPGSSGRPWSSVIWPVTPTGSTGRFGLTGTFEAWKMVRLAESMERARLEAVEGPHGCL
jgi:hypothetical protein